MKKLSIFIVLSTFALVILACGPSASNSLVANNKEIKSAPIGNLTVSILSKNGQLKHGSEEFLLTFKDSSGKTIDVGSVSLNFYMPGMGTMPVMNNPASFTTTDTPGVYKGNANIEMAGEWQAQIAYEGSAGKGKTSFPVMVQ
jgi:hypothetical protein